MNIQAIQMFAAGLGLLGLGLLLGVIFYPKLKNEKQGYPFENELEAALLPYLFQAICAAFKASQEMVAAGNEALDGVSKKAIADAVYDLLPAYVGGIPVGLIKVVVSRERLQELAQAAYDKFGGASNPSISMTSQALQLQLIPMVASFQIYLSRSICLNNL